MTIITSTPTSSIILTDPSTINLTLINRIYTSGPMTGLPNNNHPAFYYLANLAFSLHYDVINPANKAGNIETNAPHPSSPEFTAFYANVLFQDLTNIYTCDLIVLLPDWDKSGGARAEIAIALSLNIPCITEAQFMSLHSMS